jgi:hypothetical protein
MPSIPKSSPDAERQAETAARQKTRKANPYLERQARRDAAPPLKRVVRETVPYLERQAARAADKAAGRVVARSSDEQKA